MPDAGGALVTLAAPVQTPVARDLAAFRRAVRDRRGEGNEYVLLLGLKAQPAFSLLARLERGIEVGALERLREALGVSSAELLETLGIPERTWARRRREGRLDRDESDRLLRVARIYGRALELLDFDAATTRAWLGEPRRALGGKVPRELLATELGAREVEALLGRIEHGVVG